MDVSDAERERILDEEIYAAIRLLAMVYPPGCKGTIVIPEDVIIKKSKNKLTLRWCVVKIFKLIDKRKVNMALTQCPECKKEISDTAQVCPNCGFALKPTAVEVVVRKKGIGCLGIIGLLFLLFIIVGVITSIKDNKKTVVTENSNYSVPKGCKKHIEIFDSAKSGIVNVNLWRNPDPDRGEVVGIIKTGSRAVIIEELKDGYIVQSPWDKSIGYISKVQVKKILYINTESLTVCKP